MVSTSEHLMLHEVGASSEHDEPITVMWRTDLNGDRHADVGVTFPGSRGTSMEVWWGVYVYCGRGSYVAVWGPEYIYAIEAPRVSVSEGAWRDLRAVRLIDENRPDHGRLVRHALRFENGRYRKARR